MPAPTKAVPRRRNEAGSGTGRMFAVTGALNVPRVPPPTARLFRLTSHDPLDVSNSTGVEAAHVRTESNVGVIDHVPVWKMVCVTPSRVRRKLRSSDRLSYPLLALV